MSKKIRMPTRPKVDPVADKWVNERATSKPDMPRNQLKRLTVEVEPDLHRELKIHCATNDRNITEMVRDLIVEKLRPGQVDPIAREIVSSDNNLG